MPGWHTKNAHQNPSIYSTRLLQYAIRVSRCKTVSMAAPIYEPWGLQRRLCEKLKAQTRADSTLGNAF